MSSRGKITSLRRRRICLWKLFLLVSIAGISCSSRVRESNMLCEDCLYTSEDVRIYEDVITPLSGSQDLSISELVVMAGKAFLGTPYAAHTLELGDEEKLVINLRAMDCTTFAENCLAVARSIKSGEATFSSFAEELRFIRYRNGQLNGYPSRLHYFCDWIYNNQEKGVVMDVSAAMGGTVFRKEVNFMSTHPERYARMVQDPSHVDALSEQEKEISGRDMYYIPEEMLIAAEMELSEGDIAGIATDIKGLAVMHVGILIRKDDGMHLMHASSASEIVCVTEATLQEYLRANKRATGIMIARPGS